MEKETFKAKCLACDYKGEQVVPEFPNPALCPVCGGLLILDKN